MLSEPRFLPFVLQNKIKRLRHLFKYQNNILSCIKCYSNSMEVFIEKHEEKHLGIMALKTLHRNDPFKLFS